MLSSMHVAEHDCMPRSQSGDSRSCKACGFSEVFNLGYLNIESRRKWQAALGAPNEFSDMLCIFRSPANSLVPTLAQVSPTRRWHTGKSTRHPDKAPRSLHSSQIEFVSYCAVQDCGAASSKDSVRSRETHHQLRNPDSCRSIERDRPAVREHGWHGEPDVQHQGRFRRCGEQLAPEVVLRARGYGDALRAEWSLPSADVPLDL